MVLDDTGAVARDFWRRRTIDFVGRPSSEVSDLRQFPNKTTPRSKIAEHPGGQDIMPRSLTVAPIATQKGEVDQRSAVARHLSIHGRYRAQTSQEMAKICDLEYPQYRLPASEFARRVIAECHRPEITRRDTVVSTSTALCGRRRSRSPVGESWVVCESDKRGGRSLGFQNMVLLGMASRESPWKSLSRDIGEMSIREERNEIVGPNEAGMVSAEVVGRLNLKFPAKMGRGRISGFQIPPWRIGCFTVLIGGDRF